MTNRYSLPDGCPRHSPWGAVDHGEQFADGVFFVSTPSHGGFKLSPANNAEIPAAFRRDDCWYEEDCDFAIPIFLLPAHFKPEEVENARKSLLTWHRREWQAHFGNVLPLSGHAGETSPAGGRNGE
jgi:hypothetical protein